MTTTAQRLSRVEDAYENLAGKEDVVGLEARLIRVVEGQKLLLSLISRIEGAQEHLATKADVEGVRAEVAEARADFARAEARQLRWMVAAIFGGISLSTGAALAIARLTMGG